MRGHRVTLGIIGTDNNYTIEHLDPSVLKDLKIGQVLSPGEGIAPFPNAQYGTSAGDVPHVHSMETDVVNGKRTIVDPDTHQVEEGVSYTRQYGTPPETPDGEIQWSEPEDFIAFQFEEGI